MAAAPAVVRAPRPQVFIPARALARRVAALGAELTELLRDDAAPAPPVLLVLMDGASVFAADLARRVPRDDLELRYVRASSYRGTASTGRVALEPLPDLAGRLVVLVDDILDTGLTLAAARRAALDAGARRVIACVLLDKPARRRPEGLPHAELTGFRIPDRFVVGYGLDLDGRWRHLPDLATLPAGAGADSTGSAAPR
jgi:hypoxanthine phosphoribosyltransferase